MRKACAGAGGIFLVASLALAMAATAALLPPAAAAAAAAAAGPRSSLAGGRRSRFLAAAAPSAVGDSCSAELPCPYSTDPNGYPSYLDCCRGVCVDTATNVFNCGGCGYACGSWPWICCDGYCFNSQNDYENCGHCGNFCRNACVNGVCDYAT